MYEFKVGDYLVYKSRKYSSRAYKVVQVPIRVSRIKLLCLDTNKTICPKIAFALESLRLAEIEEMI